MPRIDTVVIGAGQAGLAASRLLTGAGRDHVVLDRGRLAERWRSERWDSLRLLSPNWMTRLPGWEYDGPDPDGYMGASELVASFEAYAHSFAAPVEIGVAVRSVRATSDGFVVVSDGGAWRADHVVIATGDAMHPRVPAIARDFASRTYQLPTSRYRNPDQLPAGGVLVVGASASGVQVADELRRAGRDVVIAAGNHTRMPRTYRGMDVFWWMARAGVLDATIDETPEPEAARRAPSLQLVGRPTHDTLDLGVLSDRGVRVAGRLLGTDGRRAHFGDDLKVSLARSDERMNRTLETIDRHIDDSGCSAEFEPPERPRRIRLRGVPTELDLVQLGVSTVVWATGFRRSYPWLRVPVLDAHGEIRQRRGVTPVRGLYVLGLRFQHHRDSNFIGGVGRDARFVVEHICGRHACEGVGA
ncbi:MAG TPA: NAD(P)-binding domain-containing protein [Acidimicrobiia bacterium]|jgi:putative flavoprotein involved in K+ transport